MRHWFSLILTAFMTLWLGVIVPGHQRGQIVLGGRSAAAQASSQTASVRGDGSSIAAGETCCPLTGQAIAPDAEQAQSDGESSDKPKPRSNGMCAVCAFRLSLDVAVAFVLILPDLGPVQLLDEQPQPQPSVVFHVSSTLIRGPPMGIGLSV